MFNTFGLDVHKFSYKDDSIIEYADELNQFYNVSWSVLASYKLSDRWSLNTLAALFLASNLEGSLSSGDFMFNGNMYVERTFHLKKGGYVQTALGAAYITLNGTTRLTPITHVKARFSKTWSAVVGLPNTYVKWDFNQKNSIKALIDINDFSAHLSNSSSLGNVTGPDRAVFTVASAGLEYNHWITPSVGGLFRITQGFWRDYELRNSSKAIYNFNTDLKQPFVSVGIKFNPMRNQQNSLNPF